MPSWTARTSRAPWTPSTASWAADMSGAYDWACLEVWVIIHDRYAGDAAGVDAWPDER